MAGWAAVGPCSVLQGLVLKIALATARGMGGRAVPSFNPCTKRVSRHPVMYCGSPDILVMEIKPGLKKSQYTLLMYTTHQWEANEPVYLQIE